MDEERGFGGHGVRLPRLCAGRTHAVASAGRALASLRRRLRDAASTTPRASGARLRAPSTGTCRPAACSTATRAARRAGSRAAELNTCHNALDRHADGGRGDQPALIYDSPVTGTHAHVHLRRAARRGRAPRRRAARPRRRARRSRRALPARWCPRRSSRCSRARAWARSTRSCSAASRRTSSRCASTTPSRASCSRPRAGSRARASSPTSRCSTRRSRRRRTRPSTA